jgi:hypothetical protein
MSQNPYQASNVPADSQRPRPTISAQLVLVTLGSVLLLLFGLAIAALGLLPSDAPGFFLLSGLHMVACGMLGLVCTWIKPRGPIRYFLSLTTMLLNAALAVRIGMLVFDGTIRGPLIIAAPLLVGVPAAINVVAAVVNLRRGSQTNT